MTRLDPVKTEGMMVENFHCELNIITLADPDELYRRVGGSMRLKASGAGATSCDMYASEKGRMHCNMGINELDCLAKSQITPPNTLEESAIITRNSSCCTQSA